MSTLYPMDFHRRVARRWAERMTTADPPGSRAHARLAGRRRNEIGHAREGLDPLPQSDATKDRSAPPADGYNPRKQT
jgi:hypothetical protein